MDTKTNSRIKLSRDSYRELRRRVLARDAWKCQLCGARSNLDVRHIQFRSRGGENCEENLISVCTDSRRIVHTVRYYANSTSVLKVRMLFRCFGKQSARLHVRNEHQGLG
jgi:5-methylcytosine-specific restriction endonuclease McrA